MSAVTRARERLWKSPEDTKAFRAYAKAVADRDPPRGEYLALRLLPRPTAGQRERAHALRREHGEGWLGPARRFVESWLEDDQCPAFVQRVSCTADQLVEGFDAILDLGPRLTVVVVPGRLSRKNARHLARLQLGDFGELSLACNRVDDVSLEILAPALRGLGRLRLEENPITAIGLRALGRSVDTLEFLGLLPAAEGERADWDSCVALLDEPGFRSLRVLQLRTYGYATDQPSNDLVRRLHEGIPGLNVEVPGAFIGQYSAEETGRDPS